MYVITGATGNIGGKIAENLLAKGKKVRVIGRSSERLKPLVDRGAEPAMGRLEGSRFLTEAFRGAEAVFAMIPQNLQSENYLGYQAVVGESICSALKNSGVKYVVNLSSQGVQLTEKTGPILGLRGQEERLNRLEGIHVLHLRPTSFMENVLNNIPIIKDMGINGSPTKADLKLPSIATKDIANVATQHLLKLDFEGKSVLDLLGERDISMNEMTQILGKAIGIENLPYVQFSYEDAEKGMIESGISADVARLYIEMEKGFNEIVLNVPRTKENTTPTSFEEFSKFFASVYKA